METEEGQERYNLIGRLRKAGLNVILSLPDNNRLERIWLLAKTEFKERYYQSVLGLLWAILNPLMLLAVYFYVFTVVFKSRIENFAIFMFLGLIIYLFFQETTSKSIILIKTKRYLLENIQINKLDIYYASIISSLIGFMFNLAVFIGISMFFDFKLYWEIILVPLLILNLLIFILATQIILSIIHIFIRDIQHVWELVVFMMFWASGILYEMDPEATWKTAILAFLTPLFGIIQNARAALMYGEGWDWVLFTHDYVYSLILLGIALILMRKYFGMAIERL